MTARIPLVINSGAIQELQSGDTFNLGTGATLVSPVITGTGTAIFSQVNIVGQGDLRLEDIAGGEYVALQAPASLASSYTLTLPIDDGTNGQALITDGSGNLSWSTAASGDVYGPASATDNAVTRFDGTTGKLLKNSGVTIDGSNNVSGVAQLNATTVDLTNLEVTNIKAKDGTASITLADSTGVATFSANPIINSGTANGVAYLNGSKVLTTGSALTFDGTTLNFGGTAQRITGDFSNATVTNRVLFQSSTTNSATVVGVIPNGTITNGQLRVYNNSDPTNASAGILTAQVGYISLQSTIEGTGTYLPLAFFTNGSEQMRLTSTGLGIGTSSPSAKLDVKTQINVTNVSGSSMLLAKGTYFGYSSYYGVTQIGGTSGNYSTVAIGYDPAVNLNSDFSGNGSEVIFRNGVKFITPNATDTGWYNTLTLKDGNLGLGVTPSAWGSAYKVAQITPALSLFSATGEANFASNIYIDSGYVTRYLASNYATQYQQINGQHIWYRAPSGTAGNAISFTQAMTLDASGNLYVSNTNAGSGVSGNITNLSSAAGSQAELRVTQGSVATVVNSYNNTNAYIGTISNHPVAFLTNNTERMRIDSSGNVGIGTSSPSNRLNVYTAASGDSFRITTGAASGSGFGYMSFADAGGRKAYIGSAAGTNDLYINTDAAGSNLILQTVSSERMRIDSSGNLLVGTTSGFSTGGAFISSVADGGSRYGINIKNTSGTNTNFIQFTNSSNASAGYIQQTAATTVSYTTSSDYRLKENIQPMQNALDVVAQLNPVTYTWKADGSDGQGFIAHELQAVVPDCVTGEKDAVDADGNPVYQGIDTSFLVATLTKAIQELKAELDATKAEVAALKGV